MGLTGLTQQEGLVLGHAGPRTCLGTMGLVLGHAWGRCLYPISTTSSEDVPEEAVCGHE